MSRAGLVLGGLAVLLPALLYLDTLDNPFVYDDYRTVVENPSVRSLVTFGVAWFFLLLMPSSSVIPLQEMMSEHRVYLASIGPFIAVATGARLALRPSLAGPPARSDSRPWPPRCWSWPRYRSSPCRATACGRTP